MECGKEKLSVAGPGEDKAMKKIITNKQGKAQPQPPKLIVKGAPVARKGACCGLR